jgi:hypothetical protein
MRPYSMAVAPCSFSMKRFSKIRMVG